MKTNKIKADEKYLGQLLSDDFAGKPAFYEKCHFPKGQALLSASCSVSTFGYLKAGSSCPLWSQGNGGSRRSEALPPPSPLGPSRRPSEACCVYPSLAADPGQRKERWEGGGQPPPGASASSGLDFLPCAYLTTASESNRKERRKKIPERTKSPLLSWDGSSGSCSRPC